MKNNKMLDEKVDGFIQALVDTAEYQSYKKAQGVFNNDEKAKKLLADFQDTQQTYTVLRRGNFPGIEEQEKKLIELQKRLQQNSEIKDLISSQQNLQLLTSEIVNEITRRIEFPFVAPQAGGGCCG